MKRFFKLTLIIGITMIALAISNIAYADDDFDILDKIFEPAKKENIDKIKGYSIKYGYIVNKETNEKIDEVLVSYFKAPKSYTTENMCEINSHGGTVIVRKILELCLKNGAELAEPGEFTKRAFLNGRIDLAQAESVIDVINAKSDKEAKSGIKQLEGFLWGNILKYAYRYGRKGDKKETAGKIKWYAQKLKELGECESNET